jgi:hypothetical protein
MAANKMEGSGPGRSGYFCKAPFQVLSPLFLDTSELSKSSTTGTKSCHMGEKLKVLFQM